jgi:hypothetical protein
LLTFCVPFQDNRKYQPAKEKLVRDFVQSLTETSYLDFVKTMIPNIGGQGGVDLRDLKKSLYNQSSPIILQNLFNLDRALAALVNVGAADAFCKEDAWIEKNQAPRLPGKVCLVEKYDGKYEYPYYGEYSWSVPADQFFEHNLTQYLFPDFPRPAPDKDDPKFQGSVNRAIQQRIRGLHKDIQAQYKNKPELQQSIKEAAERDATYQWHATLNPLQYQMDSQKRMAEKTAKKLAEAKARYDKARESNPDKKDAKRNLEMFTAFSDEVEQVVTTAAKDWELWISTDSSQSKAQRACRDFLLKMINEIGNISIPTPKAHSNLSWFAEIMVRLAIATDALERNFSTHGQALRSLFACFELWLPSLLHIHTVFLGPHSQGKSFVLVWLFKVLIEGTCSKQFSGSALERYAQGAAAQMHKQVKIFEELPNTAMGIADGASNANKHGAASQATTDKAAGIRASMTASDANGYSRLEKDEKTGKYVRTVFNEIIDELTIGAMNLRKNELPANMGSRYNVEEFGEQVSRSLLVFYDCLIFVCVGPRRMFVCVLCYAKQRD